MKPLLLPLSLFALLFFILFPLGKIFLHPDMLANLVPAALLAAPLLLKPLPEERLGKWRHLLGLLNLDVGFGQFRKSLTAFAASVFLSFPPFLLGAHYWMLWIAGAQSFEWAPAAFFTAPLLPQILLVAFPEELFFRGWLQPEFNRVFKPRWRILGVSLGWGWVLTAALFALAHSLIRVQWWHFSIFFPALLFGYLREKTGSITAPVLFHAFSNAFMHWFVRCYFG